MAHVAIEKLGAMVLMLIKCYVIPLEVISREAWYGAHDTPMAKEAMKFSPS